MELLFAFGTIVHMVDRFSIIACLALLLSSIYFAKAQAFKLTKFYLAITGCYFGRVEQNVL